MKINKLSAYNFNLPPELIAQKPALPPDTCRLLILDRQLKKMTDGKFLNLPKYLIGNKSKSAHHVRHSERSEESPWDSASKEILRYAQDDMMRGDVLVFNNSKVLPARLIGTKTTGGKVEILLLKQLTPNTWECLVGNLPQHKQIGTTLTFSGSQGSHALAGKIISRKHNTSQINFNLSGSKLMAQIFKLGQTPTPPYIKRLAKATEYQNFFAKKIGSVAAPTAGLHFTPRIFKKLKAKGVQIEFVTLHVGLGTFAPIKTEDITEHQIHSEYFELDKATAKRLNQAKKQGRRIIAVGTTTVRVLESCAVDVTLRLSKGDRHNIVVREPGIGRDWLHHDNFLQPKTGSTSIYIYPGYKFKFIDALITNFHVPKSSLLILVSALAGKKLIDQAYEYAIKKKYRFYSFGDAMFIK